MSRASFLEKTKQASSLLPAILTLVCLAAAELPKSESTAPDPPSTRYAVPISNCSCLNVKLPSQDVVNCSHVTVAFLLQSLRSIDINITAESSCSKMVTSQDDEDDSSEESDEDDCDEDINSEQVEATIKSIKVILSDLATVLSIASLDAPATIDLSPPKAVPQDEYNMICQDDPPSESDDQSDKPTPGQASVSAANNSIIKEKLKLLANKLQNLSEQAEIPWLRCVFPTEEELELEQLEELEEIFSKYVDPAVYTVIFALGVVWNGVLVLIFVREKDLWTPPNVMVFNLALADLISLIWNVAFFCFEMYIKEDIDNDEYFCRYHVIGRPMSIALVALSEGALSILRYVGILYCPNKVKQTKTRFFLYILILWFLALCLAYPYTYMVKYTPGNCVKYGNKELTKILITSEFAVYFGLLPAVMIVFNTLTARKLKQSVRELSSSLQKCGQDEVRHRSANMLMVFMTIFLLTCVPHYVLRLIRFWDVPCNWKLEHLWLYKVSYYPLFSNHCLNPISLYLMSGTFRAHYKFYFLCLFRKIRNSGEQSKSQAA